MFVFLIKTLFKDTMSLFIYPFIKIVGVLRGSDGVRILVYHCIGDTKQKREMKDTYISSDLFKRHMEYLFKIKFNVISLRELYDYMKGAAEINSKRTVCLTFDDGFNNDYSILKNLGFKATLFPVCGFVEREMPHSSNNYFFNRPFSWSQLRELSNAGFCIGSHSLTHRNLSGLQISQLKEEIINSKKMIEQRLSRPVDFFAYPFGDCSSFNKAVKKTVKEGGYLAGFINIMGTNKRGDDFFSLKRTRISQNDRLWKFKLKVAGAYDWIDFVKRIFRC